MSRVIKCAVLHGSPRVVDIPQAAVLSEEAGDVISSADTVDFADTVQETLLAECRQQAATLLADAQAECERMLSGARIRVEEIIAKGRQEADTLKQQAIEDGTATGYQEGLAQGKADGCNAAQQEMQQAVQAANEKAQRILQAVEAEQQQALQQAEGKMVEIVLAIADKIIPQHFIDAPQLILPLVQQALHKVKDQKSIVIRVSEQNYEFVLLARNELQRMVDGDEKLTIVADSLLDNPDCIVESANGNVDARLSTQMDILKKAVQEVVK